MDPKRLLEKLVEKTALDREHAQLAVGAVLRTLGERMAPLDVAVAAQHLPPALAGFLRERERPGDFAIDEMFRRVADREGVATSFGPEHTRVVLQLLAAELDRGALVLLRARLPDEFSELLRAPDEEPRAVPGRPARARERTLATGRPGSERPLSEASEQRTQTQSVAVEENPHADVKLSSARGISTERQGRTLAEGHTGGSHPIAEDD